MVEKVAKIKATTWVKDLQQVFGTKKASPKAAAPMPPPKPAKPTPAPKAQSNSAGSGLEKAQTMDTESQEPATPPMTLQSMPLKPSLW